MIGSCDNIRGRSTHSRLRVGFFRTVDTNELAFGVTKIPIQFHPAESRKKSRDEGLRPVCTAVNRLIIGRPVRRAAAPTTAPMYIGTQPFTL